ncbi:MAG: hypothetical protein CVU92_01970 [Firmicutes bacterium HGW-Firmicutes-17]|nr:MAG: hypothetical protein CVU92_01970 [Firmicutes bacterium HGW-Firmicutes-17]
MSDYSRGSEWRRWDLHVHTPETNKNDLFNGSSPEEKWNTFYSDVETYIGDGDDPLKNIAAIGITDYLSIENYLKIKRDNRLPQSVALVLPNIEMRIAIPAQNSPVNIHFIFDPAFDNHIESRFLGKLKFSYPGHGEFSAIRTEIVRLGKAFDNSLQETAAYKKGIELFLPSFDSIKNIFDVNKDMKEHVIIAVANSSTDGISGIGNGNGQMQGVKRSILHFIDLVFSGNPSDRDYYLGKKTSSPINVLQAECGGLKPCIHGCDAHENAKLFEPDHQRYCWIKADPTFSGLKQIVYEPEERVCISAMKPQVKPSYQVIESMTIEHPDFQSDPVVFNDKLNCIIGGKSTGKSILLHNLARAISLKQVVEKCEIAGLKVRGDKKSKPMTWELDPNMVTVNWLDGTASAERKIVYIPQTYLNRLADSSEETTEIDNIVEQIVLERKDKSGKPLSNAKTILLSKIDKLKSSTASKLFELIRKHEQFMHTEELTANIGKKELVEQELADLRKQRDELSQSLRLSDEDIKSYDTAVANIDCQLRKIEKIENEIIKITNTVSIVQSIGVFDGLSEETFGKVSAVIDTLISTANVSWNAQKFEIIAELEIKREASIKLRDDSTVVHDKLKGTIESSNAIKELAAKMSVETEKLKQIEGFEQTALEVKNQFNTLLDDISASLINFRSYYDEFADYINQNTQSEDVDLSYSVQIPFRQEDFVSKWIDVFGIKSIKSRELVNTETFASSDYTIDLIKSIIMKTLNGEIVPLKSATNEQALRSILDDWFNVKYVVQMGNDTMGKMSPGKKALVLLKLLIKLADSDCPILIDQPEDDLDNRSIYDLLIEFIRNKKINRQIIIVTHNANIVLGADADEIIVANQDGIDSAKKSHRFEYRSGSIENDLSVYKSDGTLDDGVLNARGIQRHICDILEGGIIAFEKRKRKYHI